MSQVHRHLQKALLYSQLHLRHGPLDLLVRIQLHLLVNQLVFLMEAHC